MTTKLILFFVAEQNRQGSTYGRMNNTTHGVPVTVSQPRWGGENRSIVALLACSPIASYARTFALPVCWHALALRSGAAGFGS